MTIEVGIGVFRNQIFEILLLAEVVLTEPRNQNLGVLSLGNVNVLGGENRRWDSALDHRVYTIEQLVDNIHIVV